MTIVIQTATTIFQIFKLVMAQFAFSTVEKDNKNERDFYKLIVKFFGEFELVL